MRSTDRSPEMGEYIGSPFGCLAAAREVVVDGYSGTPLAKKLAIRPGSRVVVRGGPDRFVDRLSPLPAGVKFLSRAGRKIDMAILFATRRAPLLRSIDRMAKLIVPDGSIWVAWPKKSSGVASELDFGIVQGMGLAAGLVDTKVCAIDETWSGLRFMRRKRDR